MSHIMEKTLASIPKLLTQSFGGGKGQTQGGPSPLGQEVMNFMKTVHRARSKSQESSIVQAELATVKEKFKHLHSPTLSASALRNVFTKVIFCHMLGYDVSFLGIEGVKLCSQLEGYNKRLGYLITCLLLNRSSEIALLMMCTLQRDLQSRNMMEIWMALTTAGQLVAEDHIQYILDAVVKNLKHSNDIVREKAIHCLLEFHRTSPALLRPVLPQLTSLLSSRDPGVLNALANVYVCLSKENPTEFTGLGGSFLHILHQIINRGFGSNFYYHMVPLPWLQIKLLKILGNLGAADPSLCRSLCPVLEALIERTKVTEPISLAILMESVKTATRIKADEKLLDLCSACVGKLLSSNAENNMRYQGLELLISLSKLKPAFAARHQVAVVECLNDSDAAIQAKTTHLLHAMANAANVKAICEKLFEQSESCASKRSQEILLMISDLAEKLVVDLSLYLHLYFKIFCSSHLTIKMRASFVELVLAQVEHFVQNSEFNQEASVAQLGKGMLDLLVNEETARANLLLSLQVLGNLVPKLKNLPLLEEQFLYAVRKFFISSDISNSSTTHHLQDPQNQEKSGEAAYAVADELKCTCLQSITKMVLGGCLKVESVIAWLETIDKTHFSKNYRIRCCYEELRHLLHHPADICVREEIMFQPKTSSLDLSLSFMDALIVCDFLQGKEGFVPRHKVLTERKVELTTSLDTSMISSPQSYSTEVSATASTNSETSLMSKQLAASLAQSKWRDFEEEDNDDQEQFTLVDVDDNCSSSERELFAGLDNLHIQTPHSSVTGKHKSLWEDEKQDNDHGMSINIGFNLHPFGLPGRSKSSTNREAKWFEEDENDNPMPDSEKNSSATDFSNLSEKLESPSNFNSNSIYSDINQSLGKSSAASRYVQKAESVLPSFPSPGEVGPAHSMYSAGMSGSYPTSFTEMSMSSTVDTLTDSDPAEDSDDNSRLETENPILTNWK